MGILFGVFGVIMMVPVVMFITMCMANIVLVDSLIAAFTCGGLAGSIMHLHPAICILIGFAAFCLVTYLSLQDKGFKVLAAAATISWAYIAGFLVNDLTGGDRIWTYFTFLITAGIVWMLHMNVRIMIGSR